MFEVILMCWLIWFLVGTSDVSPQSRKVISFLVACLGGFSHYDPKVGCKGYILQCVASINHTVTAQ